MTLHWTEQDQLGDEWRAGLLGPGSIFELVDDEVLRVSTPVFAQRPRSLGEVLLRAADARGERDYLIGPDRSVSFADTPAVVTAIARRLVDDYGVSAGDVVALAGHVSVDHCLAFWAVAGLGAVAATLNPAWTATELAHAVRLTAPVLVIGERPVLDRLPPGELATAEFTAVTAGPLAASAELSVGAPDDLLTEATVDEDDPLAIVFTSGTTGRPKGATLSHRNAIQFSLAAAATTAVHNIVHEIPSSRGPSTVIASAPLFHMSGLLGQLTNAAFWGITMVIPPAGRWDETVHLELTERHRVTTWSVVPTQLWRLIDHPELDRFELGSLDTIGGGGSTFPPELLRRTAERLPHVSLALRVGYGMTETAGTVTLLQPPYDDARRASVGTPVAGTEICVRGPDGRAVADGDIGEIHARSAQVFLGYWGDRAATSAALDADRWYATGDFGRIDDGYLYLESRLRDLVIRGGENIYPIEIENRLVEHPAVAEAAVVGVAHATLGQEVKAVVVRRPGSHVDVDDLRAWAAETLAPHKVPAHVVFVAELPRNATGKVLKDQLA